MRWISLVAAVLIVSTGCSDKKSTKGTAEGGKELKLTAPGGLTLKQGEAKNVKITISRKEFNEPVDVDISGLPEGVTIKEGKKLKIDKDAVEVTITVMADEKAPVTKEGAKAMISASGGGVNTTNPAEWTIKVEEKSGK